MSLARWDLSTIVYFRASQMVMFEAGGECATGWKQLDRIAGLVPKPNEAVEWVHQLP